MTASASGDIVGGAGNGFGPVAVAYGEGMSEEVGHSETASSTAVSYSPRHFASARSRFAYAGSAFIRCSFWIIRATSLTLSTKA